MRVWRCASRLSSAWVCRSGRAFRPVRCRYSARSRRSPMACCTSRSILTGDDSARGLIHRPSRCSRPVCPADRRSSRPRRGGSRGEIALEEGCRAGLHVQVTTAMSISTRALGRTSLDGVMLVNYGTTGALEPQAIIHIARNRIGRIAISPSACAGRTARSRDRSRRPAPCPRRCAASASLSMASCTPWHHRR